MPSSLNVLQLALNKRFSPSKRKKACLENEIAIYKKQKLKLKSSFNIKN